MVNVWKRGGIPFLFWQKQVKNGAQVPLDTGKKLVLAKTDDIVHNICSP